MYHYVGSQYMISPAFGSLQPVFKKIAFSFAIPTIVYLGALYAVSILFYPLALTVAHKQSQSVSVRFIFFRIFAGSHHKHSNTITGWSVWIGIIACLWIAAFIIAELIPFFSDLLSLMSSLFGKFLQKSIYMSTLTSHSIDGFFGYALPRLSWP